MEIFNLKPEDEHIDLYASINRWKGEKESKIEVTLNEKILTWLIRNEPPTKKEASDAFIDEGIKDKSISTPYELETDEKIAEQEKMVRGY